MKFIFLTLLCAVTYYTGSAQITITQADMPVAGDTFAYSNSSIIGSGISPSDSGANVAWAYALASTGQGLNVYKTTTEVSPILAVTLPTGLYGYQTADSIPDISLLVPGITIQNLYTFFEKIDIPSSFAAVAFEASVAGFPLSTLYTSPDPWYIFPLTYGSADSNNYELDISLLTYGSIKETGYRKTRVDGWGTITTPYYTTPVNCIRVRSEIHETDSISISGTNLAIPNNSVQYKWLVHGDPNPALWVTSQAIAGAEIIASIQYRDHYTDTTTTILSAPELKAGNENVTAYPNPARDGIVTLKIPENWQNYLVDVYDIQSRNVFTAVNDPVINLQTLPAGTYIARVTSGRNIAFVPITK